MREKINVLVQLMNLLRILEKIRKKDEKCLESIILRNKKYRNTNEDDFQMPMSAVLQLSVSVMAGELPDDMIDREPTESFLGYEDIIDKKPTVPLPDSILNAPMESIEELEKRQ